MRQIAESCGGDAGQIRARIAETGESRGKMHNPVTGSGGVLVGTVEEIGPGHPDRGVRPGDTRCTLVSLSLTQRAGHRSAAILSTRQRGRIVFFSMATSFKAAALGAEGLGRDVEIWIGNGYLEGWVEQAFALVRSHPELQCEFLRL